MQEFEDLRIKPITMDVDEVEIDHDADEERKIQYLINHLIAHGQRLCLLAAGADGKEAHGLSAPWSSEPKNDCFDPGKPYWRNMIRRHVKSKEAQLHVRFKDTPNELVVEYAANLKLGMYFGGWSDVGNNKVANFGIDCDRSREHQLLIANKTMDAEAWESKWKADPEEVESEKKRLVSMMEIGMKKFPNAAFFSKPNGKWHAHGNLDTPMDANEVKRRVHAMIPEEWKIEGKSFVEVFPKSAVGGPLKEYSLGNQMRLPFGASGYQPLDPTLPPIKPTELAELPQEEPKIEMEMKPVQQVALRLGNGDVVVDGVTYPLEELRSRGFKYICGDKFPMSMSGSGKGDDTLFYASNSLRGGLCLSESDALDIMRQYNDIKCKPKWPEDRLIHKIKEFDPTKLGKYKDGTPKKMGWLLTSGKNEPEPPKDGHIKPDPMFIPSDIEVDPNVDPKTGLPKNMPVWNMVERPVYVLPSYEEVMYAIGEAPQGVHIREICESYDGLDFEPAMLDAHFLATQNLNKRKTVLALSQSGLPDYVNMYGLKLMSPGTGKGLSTKILLELLKTMKVERFRGESKAAIVGYMEDFPDTAFGYYYVSEISNILEKTNPIALQVTNFFLEAFDEHEAAWHTKPKGVPHSIVISPCSPSLYVEGQPKKFESACESANLDTGMTPRFLPCFPYSSPQIKIRKDPDIQKIAQAYAGYGKAAHRIIRPVYSPKCRMTDYLQHMTDEEKYFYNRYIGQYIYRIAATLDPRSAEQGVMPKELIDRAGVVMDFYFGRGIKLLSYIHPDKEEVIRMKMERYVSEHWGCTQADLLSHLKCSLYKFQRDIAATVEARGGAIPYEEKLGKKNTRTRWFPPNKPSFIPEWKKPSLMTFDHEEKKEQSSSMFGAVKQSEDKGIQESPFLGWEGGVLSHVSPPPIPPNPQTQNPKEPKDLTAPNIDANLDGFKAKLADLTESERFSVVAAINAKGATKISELIGILGSKEAVVKFLEDEIAAAKAGF